MTGDSREELETFPEDREELEYDVQGAQSIALKFAGILAALVVTATAGCLHMNAGLPPSLRLPLLRYKSPASGVYHVVERDESLWNIAKTYGVDLQALAEVNNLKPPYTLKPHDKIFVPSATAIKKVETASTPAEEQTVEDFSGALVWPVKGKIISEFGVRDGTQHNGIEIQADEGWPVRAAAAGRVGYIGVIQPYGNVVLIDHPNRLVTVYGHLKEIRVENNAEVKRDDVIGTVGTSGRADVPCLHFEVRSRSKPRNPLFFLDQKALADAYQLGQEDRRLEKDRKETEAKH
jgi:murein DD-endopeptidase MepM/ murein hydrolase activator NlpD